MTSAPTPPEADIAELKRFGLVAETGEQFLVGRYRYGSRAADSKPEAGRPPPAGNDA